METQSHKQRTAASLDCQSKGAHLVTVKTQAKLQYLTVVYSPLVWVGLLYNKTSKVYVWDEDGSIMTNATYNELFGFDLMSSSPS
nr:hypothetical protein BgiMline_013574 [Biomphalaria glabrata]